MRRRTVLATSTTIAAVPLASLAGCLDADSRAGSNGSDGETTEPTETPETPEPTETPDSSNARAPEEYDTCSRMVVPFSSLPEPARVEARTAVDDGVYETDGEPYLPNLIDVEQSYLEVDGDAHRVHVERNDTTRIELEEATPTRGHRSFAVENGTDDALSATVTVERVGGDVVLSETLEIDADGRASAGSFDRVFGDFVVSVETESFDGTHRFSERESAMPLEGVVVDAEEVVPLPRAVMELVSCEEEWGTRGE